MPRSYSIAEARSHLPQLVRQAEEGLAVTLTRRSEPVAVIVGKRVFERLSAKRTSFPDAWARFRREFDLSALDIDPAVVFGGVRAGEAGRDVEL